MGIPGQLLRNGGSDAYQQVHRVNPVAIDFMAGGRVTILVVGSMY